MHLPATNPMNESASLSSPTAQVTIQFENIPSELTWPRN